MTKINRRFCQWLLQSKKMGITTYGTTHGLGYLDLRFRENFDYLINPTTLYENKLNSLTGIIEKKPAILILKWFNGPNQKYFKKTITIDLRTKPHLLGLYNTRHTFNPFAEMEEQMELEKMQKKKRKNQGSRLNNIVPNYLMQADDESVGESLW